MCISSNVPDPHDTSGDDTPVEEYLFPRISNPTEIDTREIPTVPDIPGDWEIDELHERLKRAESVLVAVAPDPRDLLQDYPHNDYIPVAVPRKVVADLARYIETMTTPEYDSAWRKASQAW